jgi:polyphosphate glucokinase
VAEIAEELKNALEADYVVLGGGNAKLLKAVPSGCRLGDNSTAFTGGFRLWDQPRDQAKWNRGRRPQPSQQTN